MEEAPRAGKKKSALSAGVGKISRMFSVESKEGKEKVHCLWRGEKKVRKFYYNLTGGKK